MPSLPRTFFVLLLVAGCTAAQAGEYEFPEHQKNHWAWQPIQQAVPPTVKNPAWLKNPIDAFILARLESESLSPAPTASREQVLRRVTFDLIGLPPTPEELDAFLNDKSPEAWENVLDRLLASPHY